jgi:hypothetical protein
MQVAHESITVIIGWNEGIGSIVLLGISVGALMCFPCLPKMKMMKTIRER